MGDPLLTQHREKGEDMKAAREEKVPKYGSEEENSEGDVIDGVEQKAVSAPKDG